MTVVLTLDLPEGLYDRLKEEAVKRGQPPEALALRCLEAQIGLPSTDPIETFIGAFNTGVADLGLNHDRYIGDELLGACRSIGSRYNLRDI